MKLYYYSIYFYYLLFLIFLFISSQECARLPQPHGRWPLRPLQRHPDARQPITRGLSRSHGAGGRRPHPHPRGPARAHPRGPAKVGRDPGGALRSEHGG